MDKPSLLLQKYQSSDFNLSHSIFFGVKVATNLQKNEKTDKVKKFCLNSNYLKFKILEIAPNHIDDFQHFDMKMQDEQMSSSLCPLGGQRTHP